MASRAPTADPTITTITGRPATAATRTTTAAGPTAIRRKSASTCSTSSTDSQTDEPPQDLYSARGPDGPVRRRRLPDRRPDRHGDRPGPGPGDERLLVLG